MIYAAPKKIQRRLREDLEMFYRELKSQGISPDDLTPAEIKEIHLELLKGPRK
jgi:hypothetical protein